MPHDLAPQRLAFIGGHGHHYLRGAISDPTLTLEATAVANDRREPDAVRRKLAGLLDKGAQWFDDPIEMLETFKPTVVNVGTQYAHQGELSVEALKRGIPVVSDKPIASSWRQLDALRDATASSGAVLLTEFNFRSMPAFRAARDVVRQGGIGAVALVTAQKSYRFRQSRPDFYKRREDYGSTMLWVASHGIDAIYFTTGLGFTGVCGAHNNITRPDYGSMEDHCAAVFTLSSGATGVVHGDFLRPDAAATHGDDRLRIAGAMGTIEIIDERCWLTTNDKSRHDITDTVQPAPVHRELLEAIRVGGNDLYSTADSLRIGAVLLAARDAADEQRRVVIEG